ncbi:hypothetical protein ACLOJK_038487 [Asimina triloba]
MVSLSLGEWWKPTTLELADHTLKRNTRFGRGFGLQQLRGRGAFQRAATERKGTTRERKRRFEHQAGWGSAQARGGTSM